MPPIPREIRATRARAIAEGVASRRSTPGSPRSIPKAPRPSGRRDRARILRALEVVDRDRPLAVASGKRTAAAPPLIDPATATCASCCRPTARSCTSASRTRAERWSAGALAEVGALARLAPRSRTARDEGDRRPRARSTTSRGKPRWTRRSAAITTETRRYAKRQMTWFRDQMPRLAGSERRRGGAAGVRLTGRLRKCLTRRVRCLIQPP